MKRHEQATALCHVCGGKDMVAGSFCVVPKLPSVAEKMAEMGRERQALSLAHEINDGDTERGLAVRAHLITMGWRPPT